MTPAPGPPILKVANLFLMGQLAAGGNVRGFLFAGARRHCLFS